MPVIDATTLGGDERIWFFALAQSDFRRAIHAIHLAIVGGNRNDVRWQDDEVYECIHDAAIIRYYRPFGACELPLNRGRAAIPASYAESNEHPQAAEMHQSVKRLRNKMIAHSDMTARDVRIIRLPDRDGEVGWKSQASAALMSPDQFVLLRVCAANALRRTELALQEATREVRQRMGPGERLELYRGRAGGDQVEK